MVAFQLLLILLCVSCHVNGSKPTRKPFVSGRLKPLLPANDPASKQQSIPVKQKLMRQLFKNYDTAIRPIWDESMSTRVSVRLVLYQIVQVVWTDEFLGWDPSAFNMIRKVTVKYWKIWRPDTYLFNSLGMQRVEMERLMDATVFTKKRGQKSHLTNLQFLNSMRNQHNKNTSGLHQNIGDDRLVNNSPEWVGEVVFWHPAIYHFNCFFNTKYFPFDTHNCSLIFGSWSFDLAEVDIWPIVNTVDLSNYIANEEWAVLNSTVSRKVVKYSCCEGNYSVIQVDIVIKRYPLYYILNLVLPTIIIAQVAIVGFFTPSSTGEDRTEKVNLGLATLLAMSIMLLMISELMPATSTYVPVVGGFFLGILCLTALGIFTSCSIITVQRRHRYGNEVPLSVQKIFSTLAVCTGVTVPDEIWIKSSEYAPVPLFATGETLLQDRDSPNNNILDPVYREKFYELHQQINSLKKQLQSKKKLERVKVQWELVAEILDRLMLVIFTLSLWSMSVFVCTVAI